MSFPCNKCGLCCKAVSKIPELAYLADETGACIYLAGTLCGIYEKRPILCNIDKAYDLYFSKVMTRKEWYAVNELACKTLQGEHDFRL